MKKKVLKLEGKFSIIAFRLTILLLILFFMLNGEKETLTDSLIHTELLKWAILLSSMHLISNAVLLFLPDRWIQKGLIAGLFSFDTILTSIAFYKTQGFQSDLFLIYFLVVFMTAVSRKSNLSFLVAGLACLLYASLFLKSHDYAQLLNPEVLIRFPLLLIVAFFSSIIIHESEENEMKALLSLQEVSSAIFSKVRLENLLPTLVEHCLKIFKADDVSVMLVGEDKKLTIAASHSLKDNIKKNVRLAIGERVAGKIAEWKESVILVGPLENDERFSGIDSRERISSSMICPLLSKHDVLGVLCATRTKNKVPFSEEDRRNSKIFVSLVSQAVDNTRLYKELEKKIKTLNQTHEKLSEIQNELIQSEKLAAIGELAAGVAHELNNPLTSILGLLDLLLGEAALTPIQREDLCSIKEQASRCSIIIANLLQFSRKHSPSKEFSNVNEILGRTLKLVAYEFKSSGIEIIEEIGHELAPIKADPYQIEQVFLNLLNNARDAVKNTENPQIIVKTKQGDEKVKVIFKDNGCGIPEPMISKIFDPFFTTKEVGQGTGLGLSISYGIVKEHGGSIQAESKVGLGSTITIELPFLAKKDLLGACTGA